MIKIVRDEWHEPIIVFRMFGRTSEIRPTGKRRFGWTLVKVTGEDMHFLSPTRDRIAKYPWADHVGKPWLDEEGHRSFPISPMQATEDWISNPPCTVTDTFVADHCTVEFIN